MKYFKRTIVLLCAILVADVSVMSGTALAGTTKYESFKAQSLITSDDIDPITPLKEGFRLGAPVDSFGNQNLEMAKNADGSLDVRVQPSTVYYRFDSAKARYVKGTYADTVLIGEEVRTHGKYGKAGANYEVLADTVYLPPKTISPAPPNPVCATAKDITLGRHFSLVGDESQTGFTATSLGIYSDFFGFVVANVSSTNNGHVAAVVAHDRGKAGINVVLTGDQNTLASGARVPFTTRYRKQNPTTLRWEESTKDETVKPGAVLQSAGRYGCDLGDWRFFAQFVWSPVRGATTGNVQFSEIARQTSAGTASPNAQDDTTYDGSTVTGDETVDPGAPFALSNVDWMYNPSTLTWDFDGEWTYTNASGFGTLTGTLGGTWSPSTNAINATAIMSGGTGRYLGSSGVGSVTGTGLRTLNGNVPANFDANWVISVM